MQICTAVHMSRIPPAPLLHAAGIMALPHLFNFFTQFYRSTCTTDVAPTIHAHETHSYRFVVLQVLLVALHAQFCQPSSNWCRLCFWSHCLQVSRKHTCQYRGKLDKLCAVYANQGWSYCICLTFVQTVFAQLAATNLSNTRYNYTVASWLAGTAF